MKLTSKIQKYDAGWIDSYRMEQLLIENVFGDDLESVHHIGSTAVPGLAAKPEIDMLTVVSLNKDYSEQLAEFEYRRGTDLSPGHHFYRKANSGVRTHKLHVCTVGHRKIDEMILFRNMLRASEDLRSSYEALKLELEETNVGGIGEYLQRKAPFVEHVVSLAKAGTGFPTA